MDSCYAAKEILLSIEKYGKIYYCPLKDNRQVDDSGGSLPYQRVDSLEWNEAEKQHGKTIKLKGLPGNHKVKLFRVVLSILTTGTNCGFKLKLFSSLVRLANDDPTSTYARDFERNSLSSL